MYQANSGTAPGSPVADVLFCRLFNRFLDNLQQLLEAQGIVASVAWASADEDSGFALCPGQPTWADDLAIFFQTPSPTQVTTCIRMIAEAAEKGLLQFGLTPNFLPNKSEALPNFLGCGNRAARREALASMCPTVESAWSPSTPT